MQSPPGRRTGAPAQRRAGYGGPASARSGHDHGGLSLQAQDGQTLAEYGILATVIVIVVLAVAIILGGDISSLFESAVSAVP